MWREIFFIGLIVLFSMGHLTLLRAQSAKNQQLENELTKLLEDNLLLLQGEDEVGYSAEELFAFVEELKRRGVFLNKEGFSKLAAYGLISEFEALSLNSYIERFGLPASINELYSTSMIDTTKLRLLSPFFKFVERADKQRLYTTALLRSSIATQTKEGYRPILESEYKKNPELRYLGSPLLLYSQIKVELPDRVMIVATAEKDPGERGVDYLSGAVEFYPKRLLSKIIVGSYLARSGQGLILWNGFSMNSSSSPTFLSPREYAATPYSSVDENRAFKGVALSWCKGRLSSDFFLSYRGVDARVTPEGYSSLLTTGLHNTPSTIARKGSLKRGMIATTLSYDASSFRYGVIAAAIKESLPYAGSNKYQLEDAQKLGLLRGNLSLYWKGVFNKLIWSGEWAYDATGRLSAVNTLSARLSDNFRSILSLYYRERGFYSPLSQVKFRGKESYPGLSLYLNGHFNSSSSFVLNTSFAKEYYLLFFKYSALLKKGPQLDYTLSFNRERVLLRYDYKNELYSWMGLSCRAIATLSNSNSSHLGGYLHGEVRFLDFIKGAVATARIATFYAKEWSCRLYSYESDLLYQFSNPLFYGKGVRWSFYLKFPVIKKTDLWLKYGSYYYSDRNFVGEGRERSKGPIKGEVKLQLRVQF